MANEYADWEELKSMRSITGSSQDEALQKAVTRASRAIDRRCGRRFWRDGVVSVRGYPSVRGRTAYSSGSEVFLTEDIADSATVSVAIGGVATEAEGLSFSYFSSSGDQGAITGLIRPSWYGGRVAITAEFGWPAVPESIEEATLLLANRRYMRKDSPEGTSGWSAEGAVGVSRFDQDIEDLVQPFVIEGFGA
jgi:hypothetical protein